MMHGSHCFNRAGNQPSNPWQMDIKWLRSLPVHATVSISLEQPGWVSCRLFIYNMSAHAVLLSYTSVTTQAGRPKLHDSWRYFWHFGKISHVARRGVLSNPVPGWGITTCHLLTSAMHQQMAHRRASSWPRSLTERNPQATDATLKTRWVFAFVVNLELRSDPLANLR